MNHYMMRSRLTFCSAELATQQRCRPCCLEQSKTPQIPHISMEVPSFTSRLQMLQINGIETCVYRYGILIPNRKGLSALVENLTNTRPLVVTGKQRSIGPISHQQTYR